MAVALFFDVGAMAADGGRQAEQAPDAAADPWAGEANAAAAAESAQRAAIEQKARDACANELAYAAYLAQSRNVADRQGAAAAKRQADDCVLRVRSFFRQRADEEARMRALVEEQRAAAMRAEQEAEAARQRAKAARDEEARREFDRQADERWETEARLADRAFMRTHLSSLLCYAARAKKHAKGLIENERQGAREGLGIINKAVVYKWQGELVTMSKLENLAKAALKERRTSPLPCKTPGADEYDACIGNIRDEATVDDEDDAYLADARNIMENAPSCTPWKRLTAR